MKLITEGMGKLTKYIVFGTSGLRPYEFHFVNEGKELLDILNHLKGQLLHPNMKQSLITMYDIINEDKKYPTTLKEMKAEMDKRRIQFKGGHYLIRWKQKNGKYVTKTYDFVEDLEYRLETLEEKGITDILILNTNESMDADTFLYWNAKEMEIKEVTK